MQEEVRDLGTTFHPNTCPSCRRSVIWAKLKAKLIAVETCAAGKGDIGLSWSLFASPNETPTAEMIVTTSRYREHHCAGRGTRGGAGGSFSGESFKRKTRGPG